MRPTRFLTWCMAATALLCASAVWAESPLGTSFTYQGRLKENGVPVTAPTARLIFRLWDADTNGNQIGSDFIAYPVQVASGLFTTTVDFGAAAFGAQARWVQIGVDKTGGTNWTWLTPRQRVTPTPQALFAENAAGLTLPFAGSLGWTAEDAFKLDYAGDGWVIRATSTGVDAGAIWGETTEFDTTAIVGKASGEVSSGIAGWSAATGPNASGVGGSFTAWGEMGSGVRAYATSGTGVNYGIYASSNSPQGYAGYFTGRGYFSGNVGIGTTTPSPNHKLHVASSDGIALYAVSSVTTAINGESQDTDNAGVWGYNDADSGPAYGVYGSSNSPDGFGGYFEGHGYFSGKLGIGTMQPSQKLDVVGTIKTTGFQLATSPVTGYVLTSDASGFGTWQPAGSGSCLWHANGTQIYYNTGNVAIGATDAAYYPLRVVSTGGTAIAGECPGEGNYGYLGDEYAGVRGIGYDGVYGETNAAAGRGVVGAAYATGAVSNIGGLFSAAGNTGIGVYGSASGAASNIGGKFSAAGNTGTGVWGIATATTGDSFGVRAEVNSPTGNAVYAEAKATSGTANGMFAVTASTQGSGVFGQNTSPTGDNEGVNGVSWSPDGKGVIGWNGSNTGNAYGVLGRTASATGVGVFGDATQASGTNYGVYGKTSSPNGYAGYFNGRGYFSGNVGLGVSSPAQKLDVAGTIQTTGFKLTTTPTAGYVLTSDASGQGTWQAPAGGESLWQQDGSNIYYAGGNVGVGVPTPDAMLDILGGQWDPNSAGDLRVGNDLYGLKICVATGGGGAGNCRVRAYGSTSKLMLGDGSSDTLTVDGSNVGIGTTAPTMTLDVNGTTKTTGFQLTTSPTAGYVLTCDASGTGTWQAPTGGGGFTLPYEGTLNSASPGIKVTNNGAGAGLYGIGGNYGVRGESDFNGVEGTSNSGTGVTGFSGTGAGVKAMTSGTGVDYPAMYARNYNANGIGIFSTCTSTDANAVFVNKGTGDIIKGFSGADAGDMVFRVENNGKTSVSVLQITGGADLSEQFDVNTSKTEAAPGMVVCIDPANPGKLVVSAKAYDRTVAGVISGAGGVQPGMLMGQRDSAADGAHPVALTGRVYVWADASSGPIEPGDMLTTSEVPGHAMKVAEYDRSRGATLGKAMSRLAEGRGLVLVLIQPQ